MDKNHEFTTQLPEKGVYAVKLLSEAEVVSANGTTEVALGWLGVQASGANEEEALQALLGELEGKLSEGPGSEAFTKFESYVSEKGRKLSDQEIFEKDVEKLRSFETRWQITQDEQYTLKPFEKASIELKDGKTVVSLEGIGEIGTGSGAGEVRQACLQALNELEGTDEAPGDKRDELLAWARKIGVPVDEKILADEAKAKAAYESAKELIKGITPDDIDGLSRQGVPLLVDFWAPWCGPCRAITPALAELQTEWADKISFRKINVDEFEGIWDRFGFKGIPALLVFKDGEEVHRIVGWGGKEKLIEELLPLVSK